MSMLLCIFQILSATEVKPYYVTEFPSKNGEPVDYVIITTDKLAPAFDSFVDWKVRKGVNCVVRTVEWINKNYLGCDTPDRMRNFLRHAHSEWFTKYVLLGGDVSEVPIRHIRTKNHYPNYYEIATDMYYSSLSGSWNANGNEGWGEVIVDSTTYDNDLFVGRFPGVTQEEIATVINKTHLYERGSLGSTEYKNKLLFVAASIHNETADDIIVHCNQIASNFPDYFDVDILHDTLSDTIPLFDTLFPPPTLSKQAFMDSLRNGYGYVYVIIHGSSSQNWDSPCAINRIDADTFYSPWTFMSVVSCYGNWVDVDCLSEHFMLNQHGWAFSFRGSSRVGWDSQELGFNDYFYAKLFADATGDSTTEIGKIDIYAKSMLIHSFFWYQDTVLVERDNSARDTYFSYLLLGDPGLRLWTNIPKTLSVEFPAICDVGVGAFKVKVKSGCCAYPIKGARVCVSKKGELYARGETDANGEITFILCPEAGGLLNICVTKQGFLPFEANTVISPTKPYIRYESHFVNGIIETGKEFLLQLVMENNGALPSSNTMVKLIPNSANVTLLDSIQNYGSIFPSITKTKTYRIKIDKEEMARELCFSIVSNFTEGSTQDTFYLNVYSPQLSHYTHSCDKSSLVPNIPVTLSCKIKNTGNLKATKVKTRLTSLTADILVVDSVADIDSIPGYTIKSIPNCFVILPISAVPVPFFVIEIEDSIARKWVDTFFFFFLFPPNSLYTFSSPYTVSIGWQPINTVYGYNVYRAPDSVLLNSDLVLDNSIFGDNGVSKFGTYTYWVTAVDSNLNESPFSLPVVGAPNPFFKPGWPCAAKNIQAYFTAAVAVGNIDMLTPELEVVSNGDDGILYAWHHNGLGVLSTDGVFANNLWSCWSSPVIADINKDGLLEIVRAQWFAGGEKLFVFRGDGSMLPGFPVTLQGDWGTLSSPVVQDLDKDGLLEIILQGHASRNVYAFRADGTGFLNSTGIFAVMDSTVASFGSPAIADIDNDDTLEIITACIGKVYAWKPTGRLLQNWPVQITGAPSSPVIGDIDPAYSGLEIAIHSTGMWTYVFHADTTLFWKKKCHNRGKADAMSSPSLGDINGDGLLEVALTGIDRLHLWNYDGSFVRNNDSVPVESLFIPMMTSISRASPIIGDVDGDNEMEIIIVSLVQGDIYAIEKDGTITHGFPIKANGVIQGTPTLADIDLDGNNELIVTTGVPDVRVWGVLGNKVEWSTFAHDNWHTGCYGFVPYDTLYITEKEKSAPMCFKLLQNTPNPFRQFTNISYSIPTTSKIELKIYDLAGRIVRTLVDKEVTKGNYTIIWDGKDDKAKRVARGVYFYRLESGNFHISQKLILM
ncbi:MAG: T9SS type A sorting domain-containing protein [Candidatus Stahlbacteria bacterium]|nr:T9SS type A sorting domain-containing protein [Candidatus Stahlbacteria bacterium]